MAQSEAPLPPPIKWDQSSLTTRLHQDWPSHLTSKPEMAALTSLGSEVRQVEELEGMDSRLSRSLAGWQSWPVLGGWRSGVGRESPFFPPLPQAEGLGLLLAGQSPWVPSRTCPPRTGACFSQLLRTR